MAKFTVIEVELNENIQQYLHEQIHADKNIIIQRAQEAKAVAMAEQMVVEKKLELLQKERTKIEEAYDLMKSEDGASDDEIMSTTGLKIASAIPRIRAVMLSINKNDKIEKKIIDGIVFYKIISSQT